MAAAIVLVRPVIPVADDHQERLAAFARLVLDRLHTTPVTSLAGRTAGALFVELLRDARRLDLLDDDFGRGCLR